MKRLINLILIIIICVQFKVLNAKDKPTIAIMPLFVERGGVCPICKGVFRKGEILAGAENILTRILYEKIEAKGLFKIISAQRPKEILSRFDKEESYKRLPSFYQKVGKELSSDFLLIGFLFRFEERIGSSIGVEKPSSVGFDLHLIRVRDGLEVWRGKFDETQRPLSENLFKLGAFLRRRASWLTAEELANVGMEEILMSLDERQIEEK